MVRSMVEHRIGSINGIDERDSIDLLARFNVIVRIEKMAAVQGHDVLREEETPNGRRTAISLQVGFSGISERYGRTSMRCSASFARRLRSGRVMYRPSAPAAM